jgi:NAD(P)-dependent dehydrogenase (short-subunit alcohol dehydrogenase family)
LTSHIIVTGGSGGIGSAVVRRLEQAGHSVTIIDTKAPDFPFAGNVEILDIGDLDAIDALSAKFRAAARRITHVVHGAAISQSALFADESREKWLKILAVNLTGTIALQQVLLPLQENDGSITFITSAGLYKGLQGQSVYIAAKAGLLGFARSLAGELGPRRIRVNAVAPGYVATPFTQSDPSLIAIEDGIIAQRALQRREVPEDVVGPILFLISDDARFITGQSLVVDGGIVRN